MKQAKIQIDADMWAQVWSDWMIVYSTTLLIEYKC